MAIFKSLFLTRKIYLVIFFIFIVFVIAITMMYKYGVIPDSLNFYKKNLIKLIPETYIDQKYDFKLIYPGNKFVFKTQKANFYIYDEEKGELNMIEIEKNTPFNLAMTPIPTSPSKFFLTVNPIDLYIFILTDESRSKGLVGLVDEDKGFCSKSYSGRNASDCEVEILSAANGRPVYILKGWSKNLSGNVMENVYVPYGDYILKLNFIYSEAGLTVKNPDAVLRQNMINYIISNSFNIDFK